MRYLPMIFGAGLLLSVGLLAGSGTANAAMPTLAWDRSAVANTAVEKVAYYHRYARRHYRRSYYGYGYNTTTDPIMAMATAGPIMVMDMGVAGGTKTGTSPGTVLLVLNLAPRNLLDRSLLFARAHDSEVHRWLDMPSHIPRVFRTHTQNERCSNVRDAAGRRDQTGGDGDSERRILQG